MFSKKTDRAEMIQKLQHRLKNNYCFVKTTDFIKFLLAFFGPSSQLMENFRPSRPSSVVILSEKCHFCTVVMYQSHSSCGWWTSSLLGPFSLPHNQPPKVMAKAVLPFTSCLEYMIPTLLADYSRFCNQHKVNKRRKKRRLQLASAASQLYY